MSCKQPVSELLKFQCSKKWEELALMKGKERERFRGDCRTVVHLVRGRNQLTLASIKGWCVAVDMPEARVLGGPQWPEGKPEGKAKWTLPNRKKPWTDDD